MRRLPGLSRSSSACTYMIHVEATNRAQNMAVTTRPEKLVFIEHWASQAALDAHNASAHFQNFVKAVEGKNDSIDIVLLQDVSDNA